MDRVRELGDASVPFRYRVNIVNERREFFYVSPRDVKDVLRKLKRDLLTYVDAPEALEWRQSETARRSAQIPAS